MADRAGAEAALGAVAIGVGDIIGPRTIIITMSRFSCSGADVGMWAITEGAEDAAA